MQTQEQKTLELIKAALAGETILLNNNRPTCLLDTALISSIINNPDWYNIKPKTKTVNYQTRLFCTTSNEVMPFNSLTHTQAEVENFTWFKRWLEPTQEHVFEYEVE